MTSIDWILLGVMAAIWFAGSIAILIICTQEILDAIRSGVGGLITKHDLKEVEARIMATQAEVIAVLTSARDNLKQVNLDVADASIKLGELTNKITELEAAIANGVVGQELADLAGEVKTLASQANEALPDPVVVPPPPV